MAARKKLVLKVPTTAALKKQAASAGIGSEVFKQLLELLGPQLLSLILKWLGDKNKPQGGLGGGLVRKIIVDFIINSRDEVLEWVEAGEDALYDALTALVAARSAGLAALLAQYKDKITSLDDTITEEVLDRVIEALKKV